MEENRLVILIQRTHYKYPYYLAHFFEDRKRGGRHVETQSLFWNSITALVLSKHLQRTIVGERNFDTIKKLNTKTMILT